MKRLLLFAVVIFAAMQVSAQLQVLKNGKPRASIAIVEESEVNRDAAMLLNKFVERMSGVRLPISLSKDKKNLILIGGMTDEVGEDGFVIDCHDGRLYIKSGGGKGALYGVATLLENELGVRYYAADAWTVEQRTDITIAEQHHAETPSFRYRQTQSYGTEDPDYVAFYRLKEPKEIFAANMWVHTFNQILPAAVYGKTHPEYYSFFNGVRHPGAHSQWCLTNPEVFELVAAKIDSIFKANPGMKLISVSQNDGNGTQCACPECKAVDEYEGSPSGNLVRFMNKLAQRFPDKEFSTLAYLYSMQPPKHTKPLPNVNIMLCSIDSKREVPLTENASGRDFVRALTGWGRISDNIFVWDYGINFDNLVTPFPNFHVLQPNMKLFKENHATMLFEQVAGFRGVDFSELRAYMLSKLMWNVEADTDSLMHTFLDGYYGKAAPYLYRYLKMREGALLGSGKDLWIYDSPVSHKEGMLRPYLLAQYDDLFDKAEAAVASDETLLKRVHAARLQQQYSKLELERTSTEGDREERIREVELFRQRGNEAGIKSLTERKNSVDDYCDLYLERFLPGISNNLALGAQVIYKNLPEYRFVPISGTALTDGLFGGSTYGESWVGWGGEDAELVVDLGDEKQFTTVRTDCLHNLGAWIFLPKSVSYAISSDNVNFTDIGTFNFEEDRDMSPKYRWATVTMPQAVSARYVKVNLKTIGTCPDWHFGVGYDGYFFIDEIQVK